MNVSDDIQQRFSSWVVGGLTGVASFAVPDGVASWSIKFGTAVLVALVTGVIHGWAKRWAHGKKGNS